MQYRGIGTRERNDESFKHDKEPNDVTQNDNGLPSQIIKNRSGADFSSISINISQYRLNHMKSVSEFMMNKSREIGWDKEKCEEMAILGFVHDIGYMFGTHENHAQIGGKILRKVGFKYWREVFCHGNPNCQYISPELDLLNMADMSVDGSGNVVGFDNRIKDIKDRHGINSKAYRHSKMVIEKLENKNRFSRPQPTI